MDERVPRSQSSRFRKPLEVFEGVDLLELSSILASSSDITIVIDGAGTIVDMAFVEGSLFEEVAKSWIGQTWRETVTDETQIKIDLLIKDAKNSNPLVWRQVNHFSQSQGDVPVSYATFSLKGGDYILAVGRDMLQIANEQRRLMNAQLSMERSYARLQASELRYRQIFRTASEAMLVIDVQTMKIKEANTVAARLFSGGANKLVGRAISDLVTATDFDLSATFMKAGLEGGTIEGIALKDRDDQTIDVTALVLHEDRQPVLILRVVPILAKDSEIAMPENRVSLKVIKAMPDGFVLVNRAGEIVATNTAFRDLVQAASVERLWGRTLDSLFERPGVDCSVLLGNIREHGFVRRLATALRGDAGIIENVEMSAVEISEGSSVMYGIIVRSIGAVDRQASVNDGVLPYSVDQLTSLVGHMSLKDVVRETTSVIEKLCIEAALELTNDNRASAAQLLGLSRQSLYDKLGRYGAE